MTSSVALNVKLCCADSDSAQSIEDSINGLIGFMGLIMSMSGESAAKPDARHIA